MVETGPVNIEHIFLILTSVHDCHLLDNDCRKPMNTQDQLLPGQDTDTDLAQVNTQQNKFPELNPSSSVPAKQSF